MLSINFWAKSWLMAAHSCIINAWRIVRICGFLFVHPPLEDWQQVLNGIKIWRVSWPWTQNVNVLFLEPLSYHICLMARSSIMLEKALDLFNSPWYAFNQLLAKSWLMAAHSCIINAWSKSEFVGFCLSTHPLRIDNKFSMGLRSGSFLAMDTKMSMFCSSSHLVITLPYGKVLHHVGKGVVSSPTFLGL